VFRLKSISVEKILIIGILTATLVPLNANLLVFKLSTWNIPAFLLLTWLVLKGISRGHLRIGQFDIWDYSIIIIILSYTVPTLLGENLRENWPSFTQYIFCLIFAFYVRRVWGKTITINMLIIFALISVFIESSIGVLQQITFSEIGNIKTYFGETPDTMGFDDRFGTGLSRVHGTLGVANLVGNWLTAFTPFVVISTYYQKDLNIKLLWLFKGIILILAAVCILLTFSRANIAIFFLLAFLSWIGYILTKSWEKIKLITKLRRFVFIIIFIIGVIGFVVSQYDVIQATVTTLQLRFSEVVEVSKVVQTSDLEFRLEMDKGAILAFMEHPILGTGFKNSRWIWPFVDTKIPSIWTYQPHNVFLIMAVEGGIILFISYVFFTMYPIYRLFRLWRKGDPAIYALFVSLIGCLGFAMIYITLTAPEFFVPFVILQGSTMGYVDNIKNRVNYSS